ncbi:diguanylate cyclase [Oceanospirillum sediminis]|uniref:diguanylate cyclase n=1 Tax=Oceanospirillum sediminis TaxID=2760088 RepID=A0A839IY51_9GAMM|nr:diguanylate cyclase [Oceanospirillum sediminis]
MLKKQVDGQDTGDQILKQVADALRNGLRKTDILCRYGGDEFIFAAVDINKTGVISVCQRIRNDLNHEISPQLKKQGFGISLGALLFTPDTDSSGE